LNLKDKRMMGHELQLSLTGDLMDNV